jgi:hypothetical protein
VILKFLYKTDDGAYQSALCDYSWVYTSLNEKDKQWYLWSNDFFSVEECLICIGYCIGSGIEGVAKVTKTDIDEIFDSSTNGG